MLRRAVSSVLCQTFHAFEIIVVDDGSTPYYAGAINNLSDPRITVIRVEANTGVATARNVGIAAARGRYVSFLDDDDEFLPSFLSATYMHLEHTPPAAALSWAGAKLLDYRIASDSEPAIRIRQFRPSYRHSVELFEELFSIGIGFGVTVKTACLTDVGAFDTRLKVAEDTDLFFRILIGGYQAVPIPDVHLILHNHTLPRLTGVSMHLVRIEACQLLLQRYGGFMDSYPTLRTQLYRQISHLQQELSNRGLVQI
jgi:glycosyltransferase involved in cell wall biosynthesis